MLVDSLFCLPQGCVSGPTALQLMVGILVSAVALGDGPEPTMYQESFL